MEDVDGRKGREGKGREGAITLSLLLHELLAGAGAAGCLGVGHCCGLCCGLVRFGVVELQLEGLGFGRLRGKKR